MTFLLVSVLYVSLSRTFETKIIQGERVPKLLNLAFIASIYTSVTYLYFLECRSIPEGTLFEQKRPKFRLTAVKWVNTQKYLV